jgi:hypothetical protein
MHGNSRAKPAAAESIKKPPAKIARTKLGIILPLLEKLLFKALLNNRKFNNKIGTTRQIRVTSRAGNNRFLKKSKDFFIQSRSEIKKDRFGIKF